MNTPIRNSEAAWDDFDLDAYHRQYEDKIIWEDVSLTRGVIGALDAYRATGQLSLQSIERGLDICNGGVMRGPALIAPYISDGGTIDWVDCGQPQVREAQRYISEGKRGNLGPWAVHQTDMGEFHAAWAGAAFRACRLGNAVDGNIFDLAPDSYGIGITCFGPESLTNVRHEWRTALRRFARAITPGGPVIMLAMYGSSGYKVGERYYPATPIQEAEALDVLGEELTSIQTFSVEATRAARSTDDPFTYTAMGGVVGLRRHPNA